MRVRVRMYKYVWSSDDVMKLAVYLLFIYRVIYLFIVLSSFSVFAIGIES